METGEWVSNLRVLQNSGGARLKMQIFCLSPRDSDSEGRGRAQTQPYLASTRRYPCKKALGITVRKIRIGGRGDGTERQKAMMKMESMPGQC